MKVTEIKDQNVRKVIQAALKNGNKVTIAADAYQTVDGKYALRIWPKTEGDSSWDLLNFLLDKAGLGKISFKGSDDSILFSVMYDSVLIFTDGPRPRGKVKESRS